MAIAGPQNVSMVASSILRESRLPASSSSGQNGNQGRGVSRASLILQMWRELEDGLLANPARERAGGRLQNGRSDGGSSGLLSSNLLYNQESPDSLGLEGSFEDENANETVGEEAMVSQTDQEDHQSMSLEQSPDFGEAERERVRETIREWMNTGANGIASPGPSMNSSPRAQLLGQTEIVRVRVVREWVQLACEQRENSGGNDEEQVAEIGSLIERVREGLVLDNNVQTRNRRDMRRICGRQALLDLLENNKQERERELHVLLERSPVRSFAFRNRIQSLLRIRLLHNRGSVENNRTNTTAESELGFLRQRHTVSGLREGFLSRLENNVHVQANEHSSSFPNNHTSVLRENETQANSSVEDVDNEHEEAEPSDEDCSPGSSSNCPEDRPCGSEVNSQGSGGCIEASLLQDVVHGDRQAATNEVSGTTVPEDDGCGIWQIISSESSECRSREQVQLEETNQAHSDIGNEELQPHGSLSNPEMVQFAGSDGLEDSNDGNLLIIPQDTSSHEHAEHGQLEETHEVIDGQHIHGDDQDQQDASSHSANAEDQGSEDAHTWDSSIQGAEQVIEDEGQEFVGGSSLNESRDGNQQELNQEEWDDGASDESFHTNTQENEVREQSQLEESSWHDSGSQQTLGNWSALPSENGVPSAGTVDLYYYSDDDNAHNIELRELLSRRRVSSLLGSGFRESLDQLLQSYVERQSNAPVDWELYEMLPPSYAVHEQEHVHTNHNEDSDDVDAHSYILRSTSAVPSNSNWEQQFHDVHWSGDVHQRPGSELEMINDLRIEMARLQQRLNDMQRMLEACMDIQLDLQRSVRQEVSAALNRSVNSSESDETVISISGSKWDCVRKGICCVCCERNIDSLLYRCGHMCTCIKCAAVLLEGRGKCPMCQAPIVEVIRAYTIQQNKPYEI